MSEGEYTPKEKIAADRKPVITIVKTHDVKVCEGEGRRVWVRGRGRREPGFTPGGGGLGGLGEGGTTSCSSLVVRWGGCG